MSDDANKPRRSRETASAQAVDAGVSHAKPESHDWAALDRYLRSQKRICGSIVVRFTRITTQPLDPDNHGGSIKATLDSLRRAFPQLIPDDHPEIIDLQLRQIRCETEQEEGTLVEVWGAA